VLSDTTTLADPAVLDSLKNQDEEKEAWGRDSGLSSCPVSCVPAPSGLPSQHFLDFSDVGLLLEDHLPGVLLEKDGTAFDEPE